MVLVRNVRRRECQPSEKPPNHSYEDRFHNDVDHIGPELRTHRRRRNHMLSKDEEEALQHGRVLDNTKVSIVIQNCNFVQQYFIRDLQRSWRKSCYPYL